MIFSEKLIHGMLIRRYKRFLADIRLGDGTVITAHCPNSGSMMGCLTEGAEVCVSAATNPLRKTLYTWEMIKINGNWVGINTIHPNQLVFEALKENQLPGFEKYGIIKREVFYNNSRFDLYAENDSEKCLIEVKNVTLKEGEYALFPDSVTSRGQKHLNSLVDARKAGFRSVMIYVVQRQDVNLFSVARNIDPDYAAAFDYAVLNGVGFFAVCAMVNERGISLTRFLEIEFGKQIVP